MRLTKRRPAEPEASFADTLPPPDETAVLRLGLSREALREELDQQRMATDDAIEQVRELRAAVLEWKQVAGAEADHADDLGTRALPSLSAYLTEPFDEPIPDDARVEDNPKCGDLYGTWPPVLGDRGAHYDSEIVAGVGELAALVAETGTEPAEVDGA
jgi:hypothetical protein